LFSRPFAARDKQICAAFTFQVTFSKNKIKIKNKKLLQTILGATQVLSLTLDNDQLDAQIYLTHLLQSSTCTCFEQYLAHPQEVKLY
jgi:hypothetical protein